MTLPQSSIDALEVDPKGDYQPGTFSIAATGGAPGSAGPFTAPIEVGVRLKGGLGSLRNLQEKAAFKIKFDEFVKGQTYLGLKKMTLNNMVQDASMIHETLAYELFRAMGVPASRTGFAYVRVNGEDFGLMLNIENLDKVALEKRFGAFQEPPQHLYEGEYGADVTPAQQGKLEVDEGKKKERTDLEALVAAVGGGPSGWRPRVEPHADLAQMARMWAVEKYIGHWDGYAGQDDAFQPNNFYLYSNPSGQFQMLPWGTDQTWGEHLPFDGSAGVLFDGCLAYSATCTGIYGDAALATLAAAAALDLDGLARCTAERLRPWQELEMGAERHPYGLDEIEAGVGTTREFIAERPGELADWLGVAAPPGPENERSCSSVGQPSPAPEVAPGPARPVLRLGRVSLRGRTLKARVRVPGSGGVRLRAAIGADDAGPSVCGGRAEARATGTIAVTCRLSRPTRHRLEAHWLRLTLRATFRPEAGSRESISRTIRLSRR